MPRPSKFFRLKNSSKDSDESFHCCGKPEDLLAEHLFFLNENRQPSSGHAELTTPETKISERDFDSMLVATLCHEHRLMKERTGHEALPSASGPSASGPSASGPSASGPSASGPSASGPSASGPSASGSRPFQSLHFRSTASSPNLMRKSRVQRTKLWAKKYIEPHINDKSFAYEEMKYPTRQDPHADEDSKENMNPRLRPARSMPLLNDPAFSNAIPSHRRRSKCLSSFSYSGLDALVGSHCDQPKTAQPKRAQHFPLNDSEPLDNVTTRTDSANSASSKPHTSIFSKNSKLSSFLSVASWNSLRSHRQEKQKES